MIWLMRFFAWGRNDIPHISDMNTAEEKDKRISSLSGDEQKGFKWLFEGYSEAWTAETMGLEKHEAKALFKRIFQKLGVKNTREIIRYYARKAVSPAGERCAVNNEAGGDLK